MDSQIEPAHSTEPGYTCGRWVYSPLDKTPVGIGPVLVSFYLSPPLKVALRYGPSYETLEFVSGGTTLRTTTTP